MESWNFRRGRPPRPLIGAPAEPECRACVIIPVRDETPSLGATLRALVDQSDQSGRPLPGSSYEVIVLANNCLDGSAELARRFSASMPTLTLHVAEVEIPADRAHVGTARKLLMDEACRRLLAAGRPRGVIASTDGDTRVGRTWLAATLAEVAAGADAVGGDIRVDRASRRAMEPQARGAYLVDVAYCRLAEELEARLDPDPADPWPRHHHHTGASLAVTAGAYARVGGLPPLPCSEDLALVAALRRADLALRHSPEVRVITSARRVGRAAGGMADTLRRWSLEGRGPSLEHPAELEARIALRRQIRDLWRARHQGHPPAVPRRLADTLGLRASRLTALIDEVPTFGALMERVRHEGTRAESGQGRGIDALEAVAMLRARLAALRDVAPCSGLLEQVDPVILLPTPASML